MRLQLLAIACASALVICCSPASPSSSPVPTAPGSTVAPGTSGEPSTSSEPSSEPSALSDLVDATVWPLVEPVGPGVVVELAGAGQSVRVGPSGGSIEAVAADGTRYTLTIPANALTFDTDITLTPVAAVTGYTVDASTLHGVDLAPHGLMLWQAATLSVVLPAGVDAAQAKAVAYDGSGANLHRVPLGRDASKIEFAVAHFSGDLVYAGDGIFLPAPPAPAPLSYEEMEQQIAEAIDREHDGEATADETATALEEILDRYLRESLVPNRQRMADDCEYGKQHLWQYVAVTRQAQLLGLGHVIERYSDDVNANGVIGDVIEACWKVKVGECVRYDPGQIREIIGLLRQAQLVGRDLDVEQFAPVACGNVGGQVVWSSDSHSVNVGDPWTLTTDDHFEATVWVTGTFSDNFYEDRGSRYIYEGLGTQTDVGGGCDVSFVGRTFGEGQATDVYLEIEGTEAYFSAFVDGTNYGHRVDCDGTLDEDQPGFGAIVTCPDESGGVTGVFDPQARSVTFDCHGTTSDEGNPSGTGSFDVTGSLTLAGYEDIVDFIKNQAAAGI